MADHWSAESDFDTWSYAIKLVKNKPGSLSQTLVVFPPFLPVHKGFVLFCCCFLLFYSLAKRIEVLLQSRTQYYSGKAKPKSNEKFACRLSCLKTNVFENSSPPSSTIVSEKKKKIHLFMLVSSGDKAGKYNSGRCKFSLSLSLSFSSLFQS